MPRACTKLVRGLYGLHPAQIVHCRWFKITNRKAMSKEANRVATAERLPSEPNYSDEFYTPLKYISPLMPFGIDPCAGPNRHAAVNIDYSQGQCGLSLPWEGLAWVNPPYSLKAEFLEKLWVHGNGFGLVPNSTESIWWQHAANQCDAFLLLKGRVAFKGPDGAKKHSNTKGSTIFAYGAEAVDRLKKAVETGALKGFIVVK
jgi:hypothetical protein